MNISDLSASQLRRAAAIKDQIESLQNELAKITGNGSIATSEAPRKKRTMSAAARAKIVAAQKARWAKFHAAKNAKKK